MGTIRKPVEEYRAERELWCPVCLSIKRDYVMCLNAHRVCSDCKPHFDVCYNVRHCRYGTPPAEAELTMALVEAAGHRFQCRWLFCNYAAVRTLLIQHEQTCIKRRLG